MIESRRRFTRTFAGASVALALAATAPTAGAQCGTQWRTGGGCTGIDASPTVMQRWDPDGAGPAGEVLVVGGSFRVAVDQVARNLAVYDPASGAWSGVGGGTSGAVQALAVDAGGRLVAAGSFSFAGGVSANAIARWDGASWSPLGAGMNGNVVALAVLPNGDLVAGGSFTLAGGVAASHVARWDGVSWSPLGSGTNNVVLALAVLPNGDVVAAGSFTSAGGVAASRVARWNGSAWVAMGAGMNADVYALQTLPTGDVVAGGPFTAAGVVLADRVARWNGTDWTSMGGGIGIPWGFLVRANGDLLAFANSGSLWRWTGAAWSLLAPALGNLGVTTAADIPGTSGLLLGGTFESVAGVAAMHVAKWNGTAASGFGAGLDRPVQAMVPLADGDVLLGGGFEYPGGVPGGSVVRWDGSVAHPLTASTTGVVYCFLVQPNGDLVVGGSFHAPTLVPGSPAFHIARWDGTSFSRIGPVGADGEVHAVVAMPNGDLVAGGYFHGIGGGGEGVERWNGTTWSALGSGLGYASQVEALAVLPNGDLVAGGLIASAPPFVANNIVRWDGSGWSPLGTGTSDRVLAVLPLADGSLLVGGAFSFAGGVAANAIARWDGATWSALGGGMNGSVRSLLQLPNGDVLATGDFTTAGGLPANRVARWDGVAWSAFGSGLDGQGRALAMRANGEVLVGGNFRIAGDVPGIHLAAIDSTCLPTAAAFGAGCSTGVLAAATLPWVDATFRSFGSGLPPVALVAAVYGVTPTVPPLALDSVFAEAAPGCQLLVAPDIVQTLVETTGAAESTILLPNTPPLVGVTFYHQMVSFEIGVGAIVSITSTNALQLTAGSF